MLINTLKGRKYILRIVVEEIDSEGKSGFLSVYLF